ncbi:PA2169 family four-helix-bundle protein [Parasediminibacterium sp. JCM 36343]|uniref:PA2169 family four-helix-bundle protein n=1 Tax=Parasediminibacterium sp. JCM 36343 TaxID=3374279 RepID=UPI00397D4D5F
MITTDTTTEILNDLVAINNDRIEGYKHALKELTDADADLKALFLSMIDESHNNKMALGTEIEVYGGTIESGTTVSGKIYRAWMDVRGVFSTDNRQAILGSCEEGEDAAQKAYSEAIEEAEMPSYIREMLAEQKDKLKASHDEIKALRDASATV